LYDWSIDNTDGAEAILENLLASGSKFSISQFYSFYADSHAEQGNFKLAIEVVERCIDLAKSIDEPFYLPYLYRKKASYGAQLSDSPQEEQDRELALAKTMAQQQGIIALINELSDPSSTLQNSQPTT
jgi:hypothetical protein